MFDWTPDSEAVLNRFNRLIVELLRGTFSRNCFRRWEVELLLDIEECNLTGANRREILRRYQKAVQRHMENGGTEPLKLSEYLARRPRKGRSTANGNPTEDLGYLKGGVADNEPALPA
ncbi:MAG: hypothetical protein KIT09_32745 [Bryobacteraceae bacterium]|nr:hypothetical protein [Bryobacteraceae bacterium]